MKILYGVQTTGNGHISRSREVIQELRNLGHDVQVILSGHNPSRLEAVAVFKPATMFRGLTFSTFRGKIRYLKTAANLNLFQFHRDIGSFKAAGFDLLINDFEPISARIARRHGLPSIGIGHQYAFFHPVPLAGDTFSSQWVMRHFAPADHPVGLHWHHFNHPILPPIVPLHLNGDPTAVRHKILVYLPFEHLSDILRLLTPLKDWNFFIYGFVERSENLGHLHFRAFSRSGFLKDLGECTGVVCNAGFELPSEALHIGKRLLVKPLAGQMEQISNARALAKLNLGGVMSELDQNSLLQWLEGPSPAPMGYPHVARLIAEWIDRGQWQDVKELARNAWEGLQNKNFDVSFKALGNTTGK
jgi:uncharacterized protein (TIGR00661 family)